MTDAILTPDGFTEAYLALLKSEIRVFAQRAWYLFDISHPCDRFKVWRSTMWEAQRPHDPVLESIFKEGHLHQPAVYARLEKMGFTVIREQDRARQWTLPNGAVISGRIDGRITGYRGTRYDPSLLLEIKTTSPYIFDTLDTMEDVKKAREHYIRTYYDQCQVGALLENVDRGVMILKNKLTGMLKSLGIFTLDYAHAEAVVKRVERLDELVKAKVDPPPIPYDPSTCDRCGFAYLCWPPKTAGEGAVVLDDEALAEEIKEWLELRPQAREFEDADKALKKKLKALVGVGTGLCGGYVITITEKHVNAEKAPRAERTDQIVSIKLL